MGHLLTAEVRADLERMLAVDAGLGMTRLEWLVTPARDASATSVKTAMDKLDWLRAIDAHQMDLSVLPNERRRFLAQVARRSTNQGLERRKERKFPILLAFVAQAAVDPLDEVVALSDQAVSARESRAKSKTDEALIERAKKGEARQLVMEMILPVLADPSIPDDEVGGMRRERIGMQRLREITSDAWKPLPRGPRPAVGAGALLHLPSSVHPERAGRDRLPGRARYGRADGGGGHLEGDEPARRT